MYINIFEEEEEEEEREGPTLIQNLLYSILRYSQTKIKTPGELDLIYFTHQI